MNFPEELKYSEDHEWVRVDGNNLTIGITDFAQSQLGDIVYVDIESLDETIEAGEVVGSIEAVKTVSDIFMPVTGEVTEINESLNDTAELINTDPYGEGWLLKAKISDQSDLDSLLSAEQYKKLVGDN